MSRRSKKTVGIIGLGIIGRRVSEHLRRQGFSVFVWNRTPRPFPNFVGSPAEIAQLTDYIQLFVSDDKALLEMVEHLKMTLQSHHIVMAHCTVAPHTMREAAEIVQRRGAQFLDAPFTGSKMAAEKGELVYYIGGDESAFRRAKPVLEASSKEIIEIGEIGQATTIKVATNMITAATVQVAAEALAVVQNAGMAPEKFAAAMRGNSSNSVTLTMKLPKMIARDFDPHFSVKHMLKDVEIATRLARSHGLSLGATEAARQSLLEEMRHDRGDYDFTSLMRVVIPPTKEQEQPEISVANHPMLDLREAAPREASVPLQKERVDSLETLPPVEDKRPEPSSEPAAESPREELKLLQDRPVEAKDQSADLSKAESAQPDGKETPQPKGEIFGDASEEKTAPELSLPPGEKVEPTEGPVEERHEPEQQALPEEEIEIPQEAESHRDGEESATPEVKAEQPSEPMRELEIGTSADGKLESAETAIEPAESASARVENESTEEPPKASLEPAETAVIEAIEEPVESRDEVAAAPEKAIEREEVSLRPKSEPEVDHLVLSERDSKFVDREEKRSLKEMWKDDDAAEESVNEPIFGEPAAEETSSDAARQVTEEKVELEEEPEPEEVRRGFFSRLFSKTSHEKDADY